MTRYTSRADLLIAAGESIKMQTAAGIEPMQKYGGSVIPIIVEGKFHIGDKLGLNEFPLAVVEGKPVFVGDELYHSPFGDGVWYKFIVEEGHKNSGGVTPLEQCLWAKPKPKTVMVELLREDAEWWLREDFCSDRQVRVQAACRKALEKA